MDQVFADVIDRDSQLLKVDPQHGVYLACGLILRGNASISDLNRNVNRLRPKMNMIHWNREGFKIGLCSQPPVGMKYSLLCLANNTCIKAHFQDLQRKVLKLYKHKAHVHHDLNVMESDMFPVALERLKELIGSYEAMEQGSAAVTKGRITPIM